MKAKHTYRLTESVSAAFMVLTLLWLTVSTPFIIEVQKELNTTCSTLPSEQSQEDNTNPFSGMNEEKSSEISISEYLHSGTALISRHSLNIEHADTQGADIYIAYYGELLSPPPEGASLFV